MRRWSPKSWRADIVLKGARLLSYRPTTALLKEVCCKYAALHGHHEAHFPVAPDEELSVIIDRYAAVWHGTSPFEDGGWEPPPGAVEPVQRESAPGSSALIRYQPFASPTGSGPWDHVRRVAALPLFARLNYVKQLSTTSIGLNIEATHNRLAHLLGTLDLLSALLQSLCWTAPANALPTAPEATATLLYGLFHDVYHGPFGHSMDRIGDLVLGDSGVSRIDKALLLAQVAEAKEKRGDLWEIARKVSHWIEDAGGQADWALKLDTLRFGKGEEAFAEEIIRFFSLLVVNPVQLARKKSGKYWLRELIDGSIDADRLDYLLRDTHALWYPTSVKARDVENIINSARVISSTHSFPVMSDGPFRLEDFEVFRVHWDKAHRDTIEELISLRAQLYLKVYEAPEKRALDEMLVHAVAWIIRRELDPEGFQSRPNRISEVLQRLVSVTDDELFHFFYEVGTKPEHRIAIALVHDVAVGRPFAEVWRAGIEYASLSEAFRMKESLTRLWNQERRELAEESARVSGTRVLLDDENDLNEDLLMQVRRRHIIPQDGDYRADQLFGMIYYLEQIFGHSFVRRECLERLLWERLLEGDGDAALSREVVVLLWNCFKKTAWQCSVDAHHDTADFKSLMMRTPLLFFSIPWVPPHASDVALASWAREEEVLFHSKGKPLRQATELPVRPRQEFYPISLFLPPVLAGHREIRKLASNLTWKMIFSLAWLRPEEVLASRTRWWDLEPPPGVLSRGMIEIE